MIVEWEGRELDIVVTGVIDEPDVNYYEVLWEFGSSDDLEWYNNHPQCSEIEQKILEALELLPYDWND